MNKVKITVLKKLFMDDIAAEYAHDTLGPCGKLQEGQIFYADLDCPPGFCHAAFRCIYQYVYALANGGGKEGFFYGDWVKEPGTAIASCNDGLRPVIFKLEATDIPSELPGKS